MDENDKVVLTPDEADALAEYQRAIHDIELQAQGAMRLMLRTRKLEGNWSIEGNTLVRR